MTVHAHTEYLPPKTWQQFEELCADTFGTDWSDPALVRHGRAGQRQHGVDIVARRGNRYPIGLQCKHKSRWPAEHLTTGDIDIEVAEAKKFRPKLKSFYILTTAPDGANLQKHARTISAKNEAKGLFDVNVLGWSEIVRRATLHSTVAEKHFGSGGGAPRAPLLATWFASKNRLEISGEDLALTCRELAHEFRDFPAGRIVLRQRESDDIVAKIAAYDGRKLTNDERKARLALRDKLALMEAEEKRLSEGLRLMLGDPTVKVWMFTIYADSGDAPRAITEFINRELHPNRASIDPQTIKMRLISPHDPQIWRSRYITQAQWSSINALKQKRDKRFGHGRHTNTVSELPDDIRADIAIPGVITEILHQLDSRPLEELRKDGFLELGEWRIDIG